MIASSGLTRIDEYQNAPAVLDAIKVQLNRSTRPGQFILTGSARHDSLPVAAQASTPRLHRMTIYPLAQSELEGTAPDLLARLFAEADLATTGRLWPPTARTTSRTSMAAGSHSPWPGTRRPLATAGSTTTSP